MLLMKTPPFTGVASTCIVQGIWNKLLDLRGDWKPKKKMKAAWSVTEPKKKKQFHSL